MASGVSSSLLVTLLAIVLIQGEATDLADVHVSASHGFEELDESMISSRIDMFSDESLRGSAKISDQISSTKERLSEHSSSQKVRKRRNVMSGGRQVQGLSAGQGCNGIILEWNALSLPFRANLQYVNSEFKHFNVYRSNSFFSDVTGMTPHASGLTDPRLRLVDNTRWIDHYPTPMVNWFYAVTIVDGKGREQTRVTAKKVIFVGAIEKEGKPILMIPSVLRGRAMHHSVAFNPNRNEYLVAFDWDMNYDGVSDHLYAARLDQAGKIVDKKVLNVSANIPGWVSGEQGWPAATFNPSSNEYLVLFHFRSTKHFSKRHVILAQRIMAAQSERAASPSLTATADGADVKEPKLLYNPKTGGYVASVIVAKPKKDIVALFLDKSVKVAKVGQVCSFPSDAYEHNLFHDSKRNEFYFTCTIEKQGALADSQLQARPFMLLMTKMDASGGHASNTPTSGTKSLIGYSNKRHTRHEGYYNQKTDRLVMFWEDLKDGKNTLSSVSLLMTRALFVREVDKHNCHLDREVKTPVLLPMPISGGHYLLWQERSQLSWSIGGQLMREGNFKLTNGIQKNPAVVYNVNRDVGFVVWQENIGRQVKLIGRHVTYSSSHTCSSACPPNQRCVQQDTCDSDRCSPNNGGCSHKCQVKTGGLLTECICPKGMELDNDQKTCINNLPCRGMTPMKNPLTGQDMFCGRGPLHVDCLKGSYCHIHPTDGFAKCCPDPLPEYAILVASQDTIWKAVINENQQKVNVSRMPFTQGFMVVAVAYDPIEKRMYWTDVLGQTIKRAYIDGKGEETILSSNVRTPDGLYLDTVDRELYWTDTGLNRIEKSKLDGSGRHVLLNTGLDEPRAIVLYKRRRQMYWTDWGKNPRIERSLVDGTNRETIITGGLGWPNGLAIDEDLRQLYWGDAKVDRIETSDLEGRNRRVLVGSDKAKHPFSIGILNNRLFWSDWQKKGVQSVNKQTGKDYSEVLNGLENPKGMFLFLTESQPINTCPDPGRPSNGNRFPAPGPNGRYDVGESLIFTCNPGYNLIGPINRRCERTGKWNKRVTKCVAPPVLTATPINTTVDEGKATVLRCSASVQRLRPVKVHWFKNGSPLTPSPDIRYHVAFTGHLIFSITRYSDRGLYKCVAQNKGGKVSATAYLKVQRSVTLKVKCGRPRFNTRARIIGGRRADRGSHPWQVMLWNKLEKRHFCGGTLITDRWLVTAAHCVHSKRLFPSNIKVRLGKHVRTRTERNEQSMEADMIKIHPNYNAMHRTYDSDIALVRTSKRVIFTDYIQPICLPSKEQDFQLISINTSGVISGWGSRKQFRNSAHRLHEANVPIVSTAACKISHPAYIITPNMFCAGQKNSSLGDACQGDSGGPFSVNSPLPSKPNIKRHVLLGVISWGDGCGHYGKYGVYTRVTNFVDWIMNEID